MNRESILIVDDNPDNLKLIEMLLECEGYAVRTAEDADRALGLLRTYRPDLILMDIQLPGMDGLELTRRLRAMPGFEKVGIVALTAYAMPGDEANARAAGCDGYITKPVATRTFAGVIRQYLVHSADAVPP
jgi:two-component system, cell cycle response regulator DivK